MTIYVTAAGKKDGLGSQVLSKILAIVYCKTHQYQYVHSPLHTLDVRGQDEVGKLAYQSGKGHLWVTQWEQMLQIGKNYPNVNEIRYNKVIDLTDVLRTGQITMKDCYLEHNFDPTLNIIRYSQQYPQKHILFICKEFPKFDQYRETDYQDILTNIRKNYKCSLPTKLLSAKMNIVLHIRYTRDSQSRRKLLTGYLKNNYQQLLIKLCQKLPNQEKQIYIISDGTKSDFPEYEFLQNSIAKLKNTTDPSLQNIQFLLKTNSITCFEMMKKADILIMFPSAYSYLAGLYNTNLVFYPKFHDKPIQEWLVYSDHAFNKFKFI